METLTQFSCPLCLCTQTPIAQIRDVVICGRCGASVVVTFDGALTKRAHRTDIEDFSDDELMTLRAARAGIARPARRPR